MFSWLSGVYASVYCAIVLVYFVVDCFFLIYMSADILHCRWSCAFYSCESSVRGINRPVIYSLNISMIYESLEVLSWGISVVSPKNFLMMRYSLTVAEFSNWRWVKSGSDQEN